MSYEDPEDFRPTAEDGDLIDQFGGSKQVGFSDVFSSLAGTQLLSVNMPAWRGRDWTVVLGAFRAGPPDANLTAGVPIDNQVATVINVANPGQVSEVANYGIQGLYVRVGWGTGNARETAFVSWPYGGCTLQMHGADIRVEMPAGFNLNVPAGVLLPRLSGFITPGSRRDGGMMSPPTLLTKQQQLDNADGQLAGAVFWVPPRAVGYRLYTEDDVDNQAVGFNPFYRVQQLLWAGAVLKGIPYAMDSTNASLYRENSNALEGGANNAFQRATGQPNDWRRLLPGTVGIKVSIPNGVDGTSLNVGVEWILDIG